MAVCGPGRRKASLGLLHAVCPLPKYGRELLGGQGRRQQVGGERVGCGEGAKWQVAAGGLGLNLWPN